MKIFNLIFPFLLLMTFTGCGGGDSTEAPEMPAPSPVVIEERAINDKYFGQQWPINFNEDFYRDNNISFQAHINAEDNLRKYSGHGIKIAIIDDGLDTNHEDLEGAISGTYDIESRTGNVTYTRWNQVHGTAIAGILSARENEVGIKGIASKSQLIFLKYKQAMSDSETIELFEKAESLGADVINCSWGTYFVSRAVKEKIQDLAKNGRKGKGLPIVFASGNSGRDVGEYDESAIPEVIAVGATDEENLRALYSNFGPQIDIVAPGGDRLGITTLDLNGPDGYSTIDQNYLLYDDHSSFRGTSAAAPIVTGAIAILLEINPELTRAEIEMILRKSSDKIGNLSYENGRNDLYGYGKLNISAAIQLASEM